MLVSEDKWDTDEARELRKRLDEWSKGCEPALVRADTEIRMKSFRRKKKETGVQISGYTRAPAQLCEGVSGRNGSISAGATAGATAK